MTRRWILLVGAALCLVWTASADAADLRILNGSDTLVYAFGHPAEDEMRGAWLRPGEALNAGPVKSRGRGLSRVLVRANLWVIIPDFHDGYVNLQRWQSGGATFDIPYGRIFSLEDCRFTESPESTDTVRFLRSRIPGDVSRRDTYAYTFHTSADCHLGSGEVTASSPPAVSARASRLASSGWQMVFGIRQPDGRLLMQPRVEPGHGPITVKLVTGDCSKSETRYCAATYAPVLMRAFNKSGLLAYEQTLRTDASGMLSLDARIITDNDVVRLDLDPQAPSRKMACFALVPRNVTPLAIITLGCHFRWVDPGPFVPAVPIF